MKEKLFNDLLRDIGTCNKCVNIKNKNDRDCSLINFYNNTNFCKNIPSIWTD